MSRGSLFLIAALAIGGAGCNKVTDSFRTKGTKPDADGYVKPKITTAHEDVPKTVRELDAASMPWAPLVCEFAVEDSGPSPVVSGAVSTTSGTPSRNVRLVFDVKNRQGGKIGQASGTIPEVAPNQPALFTFPAPRGAYSAEIVRLNAK